MTVELLGTLFMIAAMIYIAYQERNSAGDNLVRSALDILSVHEKRIKQLEVDLIWYRNGVRILIQQLRDAGIEPLWTPDSPRTKE